MDRQFYEGKTIDNPPFAHSDLNKLSYKADLESVLRLWNIYEGLLGFARRNNIVNLNATNGGFLDVFPLVRYEDVIGR